MIPLEVQEKLKKAASKAEACRVLAENGIDVEKIEKKIASGLSQLKFGVHQLSDDVLDKIAGGCGDEGEGIGMLISLIYDAANTPEGKAFGKGFFNDIPGLVSNWRDSK